MKSPARLSKLAVFGLILGISSFLIFILIPIAMMTGLAALYRIKRSGGSLKGTPFAACGMVAGAAAFIFAGSMFINYEMRYRSFKVPTASMYPAIKSKDRIVADLRAYEAKDPQRGEIVVYELLHDGKRRLMCKRVVGLPGEAIEIRSGKVYVNGAPVEMPNLPKGILYSNGGALGMGGKPVKIPENAYYLIGDNPDRSFDSRQHGPVDRKDIKGKYIFSYKGIIN
jgi:signal peptidase I